MADLIKLVPLYMQRVWGGRNLETVYGRELPDRAAPYGESWEVVDRQGEQSVVAGGEFDGLTLNELWSEHRPEVFGEGMPDSERFPLLVKILDAQDDLSIQVHPPANVAGELGGEAKTEMWYVASAEPGAALYVGLRAGVSREKFERGIAEGATADQVHRIEPKAGDFIFIPSGRLHAIGAGLVIYEIQENSDTTYRVFDWNRVGLDGVPRDLHVSESLRCIDFDDVEPEMGVANGEILVECPLFAVERWSLAAGDRRAAVSDNRFAIVSVIEGELRCGTRAFTKGDFFIVPANARDAEIRSDEGATVLRTTIPKAD
jgi:mannose-6-phosphate isomerase